MTYKISLLIISLMLVVGLVACGSKGDDATPEPDAPAAASSSDTATADEPADAAPTKAPEPTVKPAPTDAPSAAADEEHDLVDRASALSKLKSYQLTWTTEWIPDDPAGEPLQMKWSQEYVADPPAQYLSWTATNPDGGTDATEAEMTSQMWRVGPTTYMLTDAQGESHCIALTQDEDEMEPPFDPSVLGGIEGAKYKGSETVNGIRTKRYAYDTIGFGLLGADKVSGEAWIAEDGDYMVKEVLNWEGGAGLFAAQTDKKGKGSWTWELSKVNESFTIVPPEECLNPAGQADFPVLPDAETRMQSAMGTQYQSKTTVADAIKFYQKEMPAAGWIIDGEPMIMDQIAMMSFKKGDQSASVMITGDDSGTTMVIVNLAE